jgi:hypothetical protein
VNKISFVAGVRRMQANSMIRGLPASPVVSQTTIDAGCI